MSGAGNGFFFLMKMHVTNKLTTYQKEGNTYYRLIITEKTSIKKRMHFTIINIIIIIRTRLGLKTHALHYY